MSLPDHTEENELPPFFNSWNQMYTAVIANLLVMIVLFYGFTKLFE